ncbi:hypothetical protein B0H13DRAFT_2042067, partial [Mycena leptocephala]
ERRRSARARTSMWAVCLRGVIWSASAGRSGHGKNKRKEVEEGEKTEARLKWIRRPGTGTGKRARKAKRQTSAV